MDYGNGVAIFYPRTATPRAISAAKVNVGNVGINVPIPVPIAYYTFGGWKKSGFGDLNQHGPDSIRFYTKTKTVTAALALRRQGRRGSRSDDELNGRRTTFTIEPSLRAPAKNPSFTCRPVDCFVASLLAMTTGTGGGNDAIRSQ